MKFFSGMKRLLFGRRLANAQMGETLLPKRIALPVFASDALSSVAYAPDEILITLSLAGMAGFMFSWQIGLAVGVVVAVVVMSYRQTVYAYPNGGGDYEVAKENLGRFAGLTVASSLLVDYVLTVAVSVSAGVINAKAMLPFLDGWEALAAVCVIVVLTIVNLRGVRESGAAFAVPTYIFMVSMILMVATGLFRIFVLGQDLMSETADLTVVRPDGGDDLMGWALIAILARAFSSGCAALTGVEAISNGVPAFKPPKSRNASRVLGMLGGLAITMLIGIIALANLTKVHLIDEGTGTHYIDQLGNTIHSAANTVTGQLARTVFMDWFAPGFYVVVTATMLILFLAANTAFNGFPSLASILAKDGYLPLQLHQRGDRLAFSNGILMLAAAAIALVILFDASVTALIQLYVVGVFISFTLGQLGMIKHWTRELRSEQEPQVRKRMIRSRVINVTGATMTGVVLVIVLVSKFTHGAYLALVAMGLLFALMLAISNHYLAVEREVALTPESDRALPSRVRGVILVQHVNLPTTKAIAFARATRPTTLTAVTVSIDDDQTELILDQWEAEDFGIPLKVIASPYREITGPFIKYVAELRTENPRDVVSVYIPEYVVGHWWEQFLHNQTALVIRTRLHFMQGVMVTSVPYQLASSDARRIRTKKAAERAKAADGRRVR
ncbi:Amino acid transporter [Tessaracoccus bendigoensis DSM 12906]|uniref:Amino acid transporter n=1 Tax=Tessaracoccus bendigoensis DSM 12906 TaxID=1123357 RepID=A0A1M6KM16_9ACTN|nr:APC family permease [Tessaracoccus bendigoensis]SHJ59981.1 Amino acid transporter [Tessaracoccus bendigoensis DSM 12906]